MAHLSLKNIQKTFGHFKALKGVDLEIQSGEFICLLGASGCGKTTLLRIIAGLEQQTDGELSLDGYDLLEKKCHLRNVGMVFQSLALFPHLNVGENVGYGFNIRGRKPNEYREQVEKLLELVDLPGLYERPTSTLSGGQQQRVAIARALAVEPDLFLMDEPFSALDANLRERLQVEVKKLQRKTGITTVFVTHDQREAMSISDRIIIMNNGKIEQAGTPTEVYAQPASEFVAQFMGTNNVLDVEFSELGEIYFQGYKLGHARSEQQHLRGTQRIAIRPEYIDLRAVIEPASTSQLTATVNFVRHLGPSIETELSLGDMTLMQTNISDGLSELKVGDKAAVELNLNHAWVLNS